MFKTTFFLSILFLFGSVFSQKQRADSIFNMLDNTPNLHERVDILHDFYRNYGATYRADIQREMVRRIFQYSEKNHDPKDNIKAYDTQERFYINIGEVGYDDSVIIIAQKRLKIAQSIQDTNVITHCQIRIANSYTNLLKFPQALPILNQCYDLSKRRKDTANLMLASLRLGRFYKYQHDYPQAEKFYREALSIQSKDALYISEDLKLYTAGVLSLADVFYETQQWDFAIVYYQSGIPMWEKLGSQLSLSIIYGALGKALGQKKRLAEATYFLEKSLNLAHSIKESGMEGNASIGFAEFFFDIKQPQLALEYCQKARILLAKASYVPEDQRWLNLTLSHIYEEAGNYEKALFHEKIANKMMDTIQKNLNKDSLSAIQTRYEVAHKNAEIKLLGESIQLKNQQRNYLIMGLLILLTAVIVAVWNYWQKRRANQLLQSQNVAILQQKDQLQALNQTKDRLFSIVSHDLRSPLSHLHSVLQVLQRGMSPKSADFSLLKSAETKLHNALLLMDNLLLWSAGQFKGIQPKAKPFYVVEALQEALFSLKEVAENKEIQVENALLEDLMGFADPNMLATILRNLLSNALKFTPQGGHIEVSGLLNEDEKNITIAVKDTGTGIPSSLNLTILEEKGQSVEGTSGEKGTGLGLNLCQTFVNANKGRLWFESEEGKGATFFVEIPAA